MSAPGDSVCSWGDLPLGGVCSRRGLLLGGVPGLGGDWSRGVPGGDPPDGYCCGQYASYWNAFFFCQLLLPTNEACEGSVFTGVCLSVHRKGVSATDPHFPRQTQPPWADTHPLGQTLPWVVHAGTPPGSACWDTHHPPAQCMLGYSQQAGGTHPTGMHSCYHKYIKEIVTKLLDFLRHLDGY